MHLGAYLGALGATMCPTWGSFEATLSKVVAKQAVEGFTEALRGHFEPMWWHLEAVLGHFEAILGPFRSHLGPI